MSSQDRPLVIGNWKMNLTRAQTLVLARQYVEAFGAAAEKIDIGAAPSLATLKEVGEIFADSPLTLAAQTVAAEAPGALTGEVSAGMLAEFGVRYCLVGHSERRQRLGESDAMVHDKVIQAMAANLVPVICVGETLDERNAQKKEVIVTGKISAALEGITLDRPVVIAYEPIWAISTSGSGQTDTGENVAIMAEVIHQALVDRFPIEQVMKYCSIIYGGSVDETNASEYLHQKYIRGALVGGASLKPERLRGVIETLTQ